MNHENQSGNGAWPGSRRSLVLLVFLAIIGFFLFTEHRAHLFGILPYLLLVWMYVHLARSEEREALAEFGEQYTRYAANTPAFLPRLGGTAKGKQIKSH